MAIDVNERYFQGRKNLFLADFADFADIADFFALATNGTRHINISSTAPLLTSHTKPPPFLTQAKYTHFFCLSNKTPWSLLNSLPR